MLRLERADFSYSDAQRRAGAASASHENDSGTRLVCVKA